MYDFSKRALSDTRALLLEGPKTLVPPALKSFLLFSISCNLAGCVSSDLSANDPDVDAH